MMVGEQHQRPLGEAQQRAAVGDPLGLGAKIGVRVKRPPGSRSG